MRAGGMPRRQRHRADHGEIFDPACGSGGMFVRSSHFIEHEGGDTAQKVAFLHRDSCHFDPARPDEYDQSKGRQGLPKKKKT